MDSPEAIDAWIEERRKRWPTVTRVQEKEKRLEEAYNRGDLNAISDRSKRRRNEGDRAGRTQKINAQRQQRQRSARETERPARETIPLPPRPSFISARESSSEESSDSDIDPIRDSVSSKRSIMSTSIDEESRTDGLEQIKKVCSFSHQVESNLTFSL